MSLPPVVDAHAHIFTRDMPFAAGAWTQPDYDFSAEQYLATLDQHGVAFGVISAATFFGDYNEYTLDALRRYRRLRATTIIADGAWHRSCAARSDLHAARFVDAGDASAAGADLGNIDRRHLHRVTAALDEPGAKPGPPPTSVSVATT